MRCRGDSLACALGEGEGALEGRLERLFLEERRRTTIVPHAFGECPVLKLMHAAVIRAADRWRGTPLANPSAGS